MRDFLAITGPTTSGKTKLSMAVAELLDAEIVCMDSRQIYLGMDIGTDKTPSAFYDRVPHHGLDMRTPNEVYSAGQFGRDARCWIAEIQGRCRVPILVGGTGFFLKALTHPMFRQPKMDRERLQGLRMFLDSRPLKELERWVRRLDPARAVLAHQGGTQRLSRTIELALLTGRPLSWWHENGELDQEPLNGVVVVLEVDRAELDERINTRVTRMVEAGLVDEVRRLLELGYRPEDPGMSGTGYREICANLRGEMSLEEALDRMRSQTRKYARRQLTWFRNQLPEDAVWMDASRPLRVQAEEVVAAWSRG
ncbi:MAG: tRNA (adenosine(37)-N6)-dimethylallyltransferase MiaA [Gemmatimonadota bacterium]|nr:tRNA (adenosine(37)-N6)-dimethylallyltransferase MiaA [Gemmatimonadota bacterium]